MCESPHYHCKCSSRGVQVDESPSYLLHVVIINAVLGSRWYTFSFIALSPRIFLRSITVTKTPSTASYRRRHHPASCPFCNGHIMTTHPHHQITRIIITFINIHFCEMFQHHHHPHRYPHDNPQAMLTPVGHMKLSPITKSRPQNPKLPNSRTPDSCTSKTTKILNLTP